MWLKKNLLKNNLKNFMIKNTSLKLKIAPKRHKSWKPYMISMNKNCITSEVLQSKTSYSMECLKQSPSSLSRISVFGYSLVINRKLLLKLERVANSYKKT